MTRPAARVVIARGATDAGRVLADVNVLVALAWPNHVHHLAALSWFGDPQRRKFATCPVTQSGFVRVSSNSRAIPGARSPRESREILRRITDLPGHLFWEDDIDLARDARIAWDRLGNHSQVTDAHVLAVALRHGGRLATLDRGITNLVPSGAAAQSVVLIDA